jgi:hypothetical protein
MAQKPAAPPPRKAEPAKKPAAKAPAKPLKKVSGAQAATPGNLDALINQYLAAFRKADQMLAQAKALVQTYREKYPELAAYLPEGAVAERAIEIREDAADSQQFRIRIPGNEPRYERRAAGEEEYEQVEPAAWLQGFKDQLAVRIAKVLLAREAAQAPLPEVTRPPV